MKSKDPDQLAMSRSLIRTFLVLLRKMCTLLVKSALSKLFCLPSEKWSALKEKNLLPMGANSFLLE